MFIGFQVENFRSFRDRQSFSMVATASPEHLESNTFDAGFRGLGRLLRSAVVYGPNAAGKTNLLRAIEFMKAFVITSAARTGGKYPYCPFKLDQSSQKRLSEFEISFIHAGARYEYGFAMGPERIEKEWLVEYVRSGVRTRSRTMFDRSWRGGEERWKFGEYLKGQRSVWKEATRPDALFLSTAIQLNSVQLKPVLDWLQTKLVVIVGDTALNETLTAKMLDAPDGKDLVLPFLQQADLGIADLEVKKEPVPPGSALNIAANAVLHQRAGATDLITVSLSHLAQDGSLVSMAFEEESSGTQILLRTAGAWQNVLANGEVLLFDEIDRNMHPSLLKYLIGKFHSTKTNPKNAQLICATHNTSLLDQRLFRRDQAWFVEKLRGGASRTYPLTDFKPRNDENLENWYMRGRYGAQPVLPANGN